MGRRRIKIKPKKRTPHEDAMFKIKVLAIILSIIVAIPVVVLAGRYSFVNSEFPFWEVSLGVGLIVCILVDIFYASRRKWESKAEKIVMRILIFLLTLLLSFTVLLFGLWHANHLLDLGEAERYYAEIEDKYSLYTRGASSYYFTFTVNGDTFEIDVSSYDYNSLDVGDSYVIEYHEGALGEPYYIAVGPVP